MGFLIQAACVSDTGKIRKNNEDNLYFHNQLLPVVHRGTGTILRFQTALRRRLCMAVFDGMGGENFGEDASYVAAVRLKQQCRNWSARFKTNEEFIPECIESINEAVVKTKKERGTDRMGTTLVMASFDKESVWIGSLGDSRAYRLRGKVLEKLTVDHVSRQPEGSKRKAPLTQYLGIDPDELLIEPHIVQIKLKDGDRFLLCSDGVTDMLTEDEISTLMLQYVDPDSCAQALVDAANSHGGRDNITVIVCTIIERERRYG